MMSPTRDDLAMMERFAVAAAIDGRMDPQYAGERYWSCRDRRELDCPDCSTMATANRKLQKRLRRQRVLLVAAALILFLGTAAFFGGAR